MISRRKFFISSLVTAATLGAKASTQASDKNSSEKFNKFRDKNIEILYVPYIGETLPSIDIREINKPKTAENIDLWSEPEDQIKNEIFQILADLKKAKPRSITFNESKSPFSKAFDSYDQSAIKAIKEFLNVESDSKRDTLALLSQ